MSAVTMDNVFEKIVAGDLPCYKLYENDHVLAFLDIEPIVPGHTLVIPKRKALTVADLPDTDAAALGIALQRVGRALTHALNISDYNILQNNGPTAGQVVRHVHFHVLPVSPEGEKLNFSWNGRPIVTEEAITLQKRVIDALTGK